MPRSNAAARNGGKEAERATRELLRAFFGPHITSPRAGELLDRGDIAGLAGWVIDVKESQASDAGQLAQVRKGLRGLPAMKAAAGAEHGAVILRPPRIPDPGRFLFVMELSDALPVIHKTLWTPDHPGATT